MANIVVIGSLNMDLVVETEKNPKRGETVLGKSFQNICGGKGANQAAAAARLGAEVTMIGCIGKDAHGIVLKEGLGQMGVNTDFVFQEDQASSGVALITVEQGNNSIIVVAGANSRLDIAHIEMREDILNRADIILLQLEIPLDTVMYVLNYARKNGIKTILNPSPACRLEESIFRKIDYFIPNETECEFYTGRKIESIQDAIHCVKLLQEKGIAAPIITLGENGSVFGDGDQVIHIPAQKVKAIDTTAAGDSFAAAFAVAVTEGKSMTEAVRFATYVSSITVTRKGAQTSIPTREEVEAVYYAKV